MSEPERVYLGDAVIYGVPHRVFSWYAHVPEHEGEYYEGDEKITYTVPPTERIEIEFTSLVLSHSTGYTTSISAFYWDQFGDGVRAATWAGCALGAWEEVHEALASHPLIHPSRVVRWPELRPDQVRADD